MIDILEEIPIEELERITEKLAQESEIAKATYDNAEKAWQRAANKHSIYNRMLSYRRQQLEDDGKSEEGGKSQETPKAEEELDKTAAILDSVKRSGAKGITPKEIEAALLASGVNLKQGYVHAILSRLKRREEIKAQGRRYYSIGDKATSET